METSTTSTDIFSPSSSSLSDIFDNSSNSSTWIYILILLAVFGFIYYNLSNSAEHMTGGTLTQLFANDMQDTYLKGNVDQLATGNFLLHWNQPTRVASGYGYGNGVPNRGQLLSTIPQVSVNPGPNTNASPLNPVSVNVPGILSSVNNTVFPRVYPKSTVSSYPNINNVLLNQHLDNDDSEKQLLREMIYDHSKNNMRNSSLNNLQNALVNACQYCKYGKCNNCPVCMNAITNNQQSVNVESYSLNAKSIGELNEESEYATVENFDSGITYSSIPSLVHKKIVKKVNKCRENFDSGVTNNSMPLSVHKKLVKKVNKCREKFDDLEDSEDYEDYNEMVRANTNGCANCPEGRCVNCPRRTGECSNCMLGMPCKTCNVINYLNDRDQLTDSNDKEDFQLSTGCTCRRKVIPAINLNQKKISDDVENFGCLLNPDSTECNNCSKCNGCKNAQCPICPKNQPIENFESSVGFGRTCPCSMNRCSNCPLCRAGNCPDCPKNQNNNTENTYIDLASFGNWQGGYRLGTNWNDATKGPGPIDVTESLVYYPDSYVGSYFINPKPDIAYPYAVIPPSRTVGGLVVQSKK